MMAKLHRRLFSNLPGTRWLPEWVARIPASINAKLLVAFLGSAVLLVVLGTVGLGTLRIANDRTAELVEQQNRITAYRQLNYDATQLLFYKASAILADFGDVIRHEGQIFSELGLLKNRLLNGLENLGRFRRDVTRGRLVPEEDMERVLGTLAD
jgi:hypothetical protein